MCIIVSTCYVVGSASTKEKVDLLKHKMGFFMRHLGATCIIIETNSKELVQNVNGGISRSVGLFVPSFLLLEIVITSSTFVIGCGSLIG